MAATYIRWPSQNSGNAGTVTSVGLADGSSTPIYNISGSPVTNSGTLTFSLKTETANKIFAGPTTGSAAQPTFRSLVAADIPSLSYANQTLSNLTSPTALNEPLNYGEYVVTPSLYNAGNSGTTLTIDLSQGSAQSITLTGNVTLTLIHPQVGGAYIFTIIQGSGPYTVTWPASVLWPGGTAPVITTTNAYTDLINLFWNGTNYFGSFQQNYAS
jgi:hypothetical protein